MTSARRSPAHLARRTAVAVLLGGGLVLTPVSAIASAAEPTAQSSSAYPPAPTPAAQTAVNTAMDQRGKPYEYGAAGPDSFDCSGLTQYAWHAAGVSLPHSSSQQSRLGTPVARADLQPGDLVFFYSPVSHVGIYIGNNQVVHAPESGDVVKVSNIDAIGNYNSARRVG
jgi:cell wall-associated NlpC family hydrolase